MSPAAGRGGAGARNEAAGDCALSAGNEDGTEGGRRGEDEAQAGLPQVSVPTCNLSCTFLLGVFH